MDSDYLILSRYCTFSSDFAQKYGELELFKKKLQTIYIQGFDDENIRALLSTMGVEQTPAIRHCGYLRQGKEAFAFAERELQRQKGAASWGGTSIAAQYRAFDQERTKRQASMQGAGAVPSS